MAKKLSPIDSTKRAAYLEAAYDAIRRDLLPEAPERGQVALSYSFPSRRVSKVLGQCHLLAGTLVGGVEQFLIVIAPRQWNSAINVLSVLCHEMAHAALPKGVGHKLPFAALVYRCGLEGKPTATVPGLDFVAWAESVTAKLPSFPAGGLETLERKVQGTRMRLYVCPECGQKVRAATDTLEITCTPCGVEFELKAGATGARTERQPC